MSLIQIAFPNFNPPPTVGSAGVKPIQTVSKVNLQKAADELKELRKKQ
jgi:hypothetical protein